MDKQIIIDGVDVSGCECIIEDYQRVNNFEGRYEHIKNVCELGERGAEYYNLFCKDNPNCHYKNWKRKEQECERLKDKLNCCFCNPYVELNDIETQRKCIEVTECFRRQLDQLKQTLTEIKEIVGIGLIDGLQPEEYSGFLKILQAQILQKISECEATNER